MMKIKNKIQKTLLSSLINSHLIDM